MVAAMMIVAPSMLLNKLATCAVEHGSEPFAAYIVQLIRSALS